MTRQAAFKRFGKPIDPVSGAEIARRSVAAVIDVTEQVMQLMSQGDYRRVHGLMEPRTREELPASLLSETWQKVLSEVGTLQACRNTRAELPDGTLIEVDEEILGGVVIGQTILECEAGEIVGRVAVNDRLSVVGVLLVPTDHGPLPF
ncbi:DUF3887 domain-containing protein [Spelaeicoccus albus]|uniref:Uncharacterized protein n=1 Tax=Spelaeicoccus albus TaxID=1280376 RepID=A0A7Z0ACE2_9MICO|nr:DUF3887 domain-containing protein [Spelaeicoccus albus]NYI67355.1 hypothetical protein [Spelaeicoccus albus]